MTLFALGLVLLLLLFLQSYGFKKLWDKGFYYRVQFSAKEAFEGDKLFLKEELVNQKILPLPWIFVNLQLSSHLAFINSPGDLYALASYRGLQRKKAFVCAKRGVYSLRDTTVKVSNFLHTSEYSKNFFQQGELVVFPKLLDDCDEMDLLYRQIDAVVLSNQLINPDPFEFRGLREYQPTDPLRNVNFKATAVAQQMMVNIHAPTAAKKLILVLNLEDMNASANLHEQSIRLCATLAQHFINQNAGVGFYSNGRSLIAGQQTKKSSSLYISNSAGQLYNIYECLACLSPGVQCTPMVEFIEKIENNEQVYIFISSHYDVVFQKSFQSLNDRGIESFLIVPSSEPIDLLEASNIVIWKAVG